MVTTIKSPLIVFNQLKHSGVVCEILVFEDGNLLQSYWKVIFIKNINFVSVRDLIPDFVCREILFRS